MSKQHRYLLILITVASLVTILFQCFWLAGNYRQEKENFVAYAERLLFESIQEERELEFRKAYSEGFQPVILGERNQGERSVYSQTNKRPPTLDLKKAGKGSLPTKLANGQDTRSIQYLPTGIRQLNFKTLQERYRKKLGLELKQNFFLDTLRVQKGETPYAASRPALTMQARLATRAPASVADISLPNPAIMSNFPLRGTTMLLDPSSDLFLSLYLKTPTWWILKKLALVFIASFLLTGLTVGCLVYLLYTLFKQKKLADIKNDFVNNMTHELKTPLATVMAATESLQQVKLDDTQQKVGLYLQMTYRAATHLTNLIDQILHLAVGENKGMHLYLEAVNVNELLRQIVETHQMLNQHHIVLALEEEIPPIHLDKIHMINAINNLVDNAIKYTIGKASLRMTSTVVKQRYVLRISDKGIGIAPTDIAHIFQPFYRVSTGNIHRIKGFGLGLHYVKQVITQHGGHIEVNSTLGKGSTFIIYLPLN